MFFSVTVIALKPLGLPSSSRGTNDSPTVPKKLKTSKGNKETGNMNNKYIITSQEQVKTMCLRMGLCPWELCASLLAVSSTTFFLQPHRVRGTGNVTEEQNLCCSLCSASDLLLLCQNWWLPIPLSCSKPLSMHLLAAKGTPHLSYGTRAGACSLDSIPCLHQGFGFFVRNGKQMCSSA